MSIFKRFEELPVWIKSKELSIYIYKLTNEKQLARDFGLRDQMRRAAISVSSNIAEGFERNSTKEFIQFLYIAKGSAGELRCQILIAKELKYISDENSRLIIELAEDVSRQLAQFIKSLKSKNYSR